MSRVLDELNKEISELIASVKDSVIMIIVEKIDLLNILGLSQPVRGLGSGFIIGERLAVTNAHVVGDVRVVKIVYSDGSIGEGEVIARDPDRDLALIMLDRKDVKILKMGDSDKIKIGEIVFAIGSPLGLPGPSVSMGVVSAVGRTIVGEGGQIVLEDLIQTDAAINPGNSGGPLVNLDGEAIGIATAIIPYAQGIGFALPINHVKRFIHLISRFGRPVRAWIGVYVSALTPETAKGLGLEIKKGVVVVKVLSGTPAYEYGVRGGDIIIKAGGHEISTPFELRKAVEENIDKGEIMLKIFRRGRVFDIKIPILIEGL
ncbi:MAG: trypsin-like peptidase domain-containing protein [Desulfurococcales archaeon]|nr:trypsin-like peptidase domain-containing protein [Desulfurococcales archaeon]